MGCVSSSFLEEDSNGIVRHHIVSLTSTTYGFLSTLDQPVQQFPTQATEIINTWELMAGLDPTPQIHSINNFKSRAPRGGENCIVLYTTTLRGIRKTYEDCNAVRTILDSLGVVVKERDVSMDVGFKEELRELIGRDKAVELPQVFARGRHVGGVETITRMHEEGKMGELVEGMEKRRESGVCEGCFGVKFMPCFRCSGSRKVTFGGFGVKGIRVVRCGECNENGLVVCPICG